MARVGWIAVRIGRGGSFCGAGCGWLSGIYGRLGARIYRGRRNCGEIRGWFGGICDQIGARIVCGWGNFGPGMVVDVVIGLGERGLQLLAMSASMSPSSLSSVRMWNGSLLRVCR